MKYLAIIPARLGSIRFPGKLLYPLMNKPVLSWVIDYVKKVFFFNDIVVATEDKEIANFMAEHYPNIKVFINKKPVHCGSQRALEVSQMYSDYDIYATIPADEPLVDYGEINKLHRFLECEFSDDILTLCTKFYYEDDLKSRLSCKVVTNKLDQVLYFSRSVIPGQKGNKLLPLEQYKKHVALMFFTKEFLREKANMMWGDWSSYIEETEGLEQNRFLDFGAKVKLKEIKHNYFGVDQKWQIDVLRIRYAKENNLPQLLGTKKSH